jgi:ABC-type branched-subunit amino acid transport system ATPase component/ABC-type branched-subunit amino acid transport system permease subunit
VTASCARAWRGPGSDYYWFLLFLLGLGVFPLGVGRLYPGFYLRFGTELLILGLFAMSVDLLMGYTGMVSLGPALFFGLGAYATALTLLKVANALWLALLISLVLCGLVAWLIGYLAMRVSGVYFAMLTLAFAQMFYEVAFHWQRVTGGSDGVTGVPDPVLGLPPFSLSLGNAYVFFYCTLTLVIVAYYLCVRLVNAPFGRVLQAIRDNEERTRFVGYDVRVIKRRVLVISGLIGGLAGALFAMLRFVDPGVFHWLTSAEVLVMNLFGGMGTLYGPIIGAMVFLFSRDLLSTYTEHWRLVLGLIFVGFVLFSPQGIVSMYRTLKAKLAPPDPEAKPQGTVVPALAQVHGAGDRRRSAAARPRTLLLETQGLSKHFGKMAVVNRLDLRVEAGELKAIIGPNGAGKTTLFNLISGKLTPTAGVVRFKGENITGLSPDAIARRGLARSFQITNVFPHRSVFENVRLAVQQRHRKHTACFTPAASLAATNDSADALLERLGLAGYRQAPACTLAYGDQRRLEFGMVLAMQPDLVLLDEPTAGMSPAEALATIDLIKRLAREVTIVLIEHNMEVVMRVSDCILVLHNGEKIAEGTPHAVAQEARVRAAYLGGL